MIGRSLLITAAVGLLAATLPCSAQDAAQPAPPAPVAAIQATPAPAPTPAPAAAPRPVRAPRAGEAAPQAPQAPAAPQGAAAPEAPRPSRRGQPINVRVEFTVSDASGGKAPVTKSLTITVADGETAMVRSESEALAPAGSGTRSAPFSADASASVEGDRIRLFFSLDYQVIDSVSGAPLKSAVRARQTVILESGRPMAISETSDPLSDRLVRVEVKATVLR